MTDNLRMGGSVDLTNCDREPIHIPGSIQPHGLLLVFRLPMLEVVQLAGDTERWLDAAPQQVLGTRLADLVEPAQLDILRECLARETISAQPAYLFAVPIANAGRFDVMLHVSGGLAVLELEPVRRGGASGARTVSRVKNMIARLQTAGDVRTLCQVAAEEVRDAIGFDRVMIYRFLPDDSGVVVAEARRPDLDPYLGLHYPASDIPQQARRLYLRNWLRLIPDVDYRPLPLVPARNPVTEEPLDMSLCSLRSVSPIHIEYLKNMAVGASMSISIIRDGTLWGLIACHHGVLKHVPCELRALCEVFGQMFSLQLEAKEQAEDYQYRLKLAAVQDHLVSLMAREENLTDGLIRQLPHLLNHISGDGVALWIDGTFAAIGRTPDRAAVEGLVAWLNDQPSVGVFASDCLSRDYAPAEAFADVASGVLSISVSRSPRDYVFWFRPEVVRTITWAGDPNKPVEAGPLGDRLTPRKSFEGWRESVRLTARSWRAAEIEAAQALRLSLHEVVLERLDQMNRERQAAQGHQDLLLAELDHRVRNTLAGIQSLVAHTSRSAKTLEGFTEALGRRIQAMAHAHTLLSESRWQGASLRAVVTDELAAFMGGREANVRIDGKDVRLRPRAALSLSMAIHELVINAAKYGALSVPGGRVAVDWAITGNGPRRALTLHWTETGGPPVTRPRQRGFGRTVIERSLEYELGGTSVIEFRPEGVFCTIEIPVAQLAATDPADVAGGSSSR